MQAFAKKLQVPSERLCQTKSPRGSQQQQQAFVPQAQGKSRVVSSRRLRLGSAVTRDNNPITKETRPVQSSKLSSTEVRPAPSSCSSSAPSAAPRHAVCIKPPSAKDDARHSSICPEVDTTVSDSRSTPRTPDSSLGSVRRHMARLTTLDLIDQVDERNNTIQELLRMGEATISGVDPSPLSKKSYHESEDGESESPSKRSWEVLDLAADGVLRSLNNQLTAITERVESECEPASNDREGLKRSDSNDSQGTTIWTGGDGPDSSDEEVQNLDCLDEDQFSVDKKCILGHELKPHRTPSDRWWCSKCMTQVPEGTHLMGCRVCNYDECQSCLQQKPEQPRCEPCSVVTAPQEIPLDEVALQQQALSLQHQMQALRNELSVVTRERDDFAFKNQKLEGHVSRMWKATLAYSSAD